MQLSVFDCNYCASNLVFNLPNCSLHQIVTRSISTKVLSSSTKMDQRENGFTTKITDLNYDCLARCFEYLDLEELLNVADSNKELRNVARCLLARNTRVWVMKYTYQRECRCERLRFRKGEKWLEISDLKLCLQFLRCCGDSISNLKVDLRANVRWPHLVKTELLVSYINEYCSESLTNIKFEECRQGALNGLTKPFEKVTKSTLSDSYPPAKEFSELFPNLRVLKLRYPEDVPLLTEKFFTNHYPLLEFLTVRTDHSTPHFENIAIALRANPQVKRLKGGAWHGTIFGTTDFSSAKEQLQNLEILELDLYKFEETVNERMILKNLKELRLNCKNFWSWTWSWGFPFRSDKLESLWVTVGNDVTIDKNEEKFCKFIADYPFVKKLTFNLPIQISHFEISKAMAFLEEIDFSGYEFKFIVDDAVRFVRQFHSLKLFRFKSSTDISMEGLVASLRDVWLVSSDGYGTSKQGQFKICKITSRS